MEEPMDLYTRVKLRGSTSNRKLKLSLSPQDSSPEPALADEVAGTSAAVKRRGRKKAENVRYEFEVGDMVWGKITSHPWWPGVIYDPALATEEALSMSKGEGCLAVFLYGDNTHGWISPNQLLPFEEHFAAKADKSDDQWNQKGVQEALVELKRRSILGFICRCHDKSSQKSFNAEEKLFEVDFGGFISGGIYSGKQMNKAREALQPEDMLGFLQKLAVNPRNVGPESADRISLITNTSRLNFYRHYVRKQPNVEDDLNEQDDLSTDLAELEAREPCTNFVWGRSNFLPKGCRQCRLPKKAKPPTPKQKAVEPGSTSELRTAANGSLTMEPPREELLKNKAPCYRRTPSQVEAMIAKRSDPGRRERLLELLKKCNEVREKIKKQLDA